MTTKQRETIAKAVGAIWGCATCVDRTVQNELWTVAKALDDMLTEDVESTMGQLKPQEPINEPPAPDYTITCADAPMTYTSDCSRCVNNTCKSVIKLTATCMGFREVK